MGDTALRERILGSKLEGEREKKGGGLQSEAPGGETISHESVEPREGGALSPRRRKVAYNEGLCRIEAYFSYSVFS
jgi:hypothetical protein